MGLAQESTQKLLSLPVEKRLTKRAPDAWDSDSLSSIFLASSFSGSHTESTPAHTRVTHAVTLTRLPLTNLTMDAAEPAFRRKHLRAYVGGYFGPSYSVEFTDQTLIYMARSDGFPDPASPRVEPTAEQWRAFRRALDKINVWQWQAHYPNPGVCDGTGWSFEVAYSDHALDSGGDNNYPDAQGDPTNSPEETKTFDRLLRAIRKLTGRPFH